VGKTKKIIQSKWFRIPVTILICIVSIELLLRLFGFAPHTPHEYHIKATPDFTLAPDQQLGFALNPGFFEVTINDRLHYSCTHQKDATRATAAISVQPDGQTRKKIFIYGCSFTYGLGVNDSLTFPWLVQKNHPEYEVKNYAVPGYGTVHAYLQLKQQIAAQNIPSIVVVSYAGFHDHRNRLTRTQQLEWSQAFVTEKGKAKQLFSKANFPYVSQPKAPLKVEYLNMKDMTSNWSASRYSSAIHLIEKAYGYYSDKESDRGRVTKRVIEAMQQLCNQHNIQLVVQGIQHSYGTHMLLQHCEKKGIATVNAMVNTSSKKYNLWPYDLHPNAKTHAIYARKLSAFLQAQRANLISSKKQEKT
jgi:hypothetical protein